MWQWLTLPWRWSVQVIRKSLYAQPEATPARSVNHHHQGNVFNVNKLKKIDKPFSRVSRSNKFSRLNINNNNGIHNKCVQWNVDPVAYLPSDLAAICLSFLDERTLLGAAILVNHEWRDAIDGGWPAVWREVSLSSPYLTDEELAGVVGTSHGAIWRLELREFSQVTARGVQCIRSLTNLRVLSVHFPKDTDEQPFNTMLSSFPLLEQFSFTGDCHVDVAFPPLVSLKIVNCGWCRTVKGLHNLPILTELQLRHCFDVDASEAWATSLREVAIIDHQTYCPQLLDRIVALQEPTALTTDFSFVASPDFFTPPHDQLSFLSRFHTLQRFDTRQQLFLRSPQLDMAREPVLNCLGDLTSLRELHIGDVEEHRLPLLKHLTNLRRLQLQSPSTRVFEYLSSLPHLTNLQITGCVNYSLVGTCKHLKQLSLHADLLSLPEVLAITQLHQLQVLWLDALLVEDAYFMHISTMQSLRELDYTNDNHDVPASVFSALPALCSLQKLRISRIRKQDLSALVDCLVQLPELKSIYTSMRRGRLSVQDETRLREALPKLQELTVRSCSL